MELKRQRDVLRADIRGNVEEWKRKTGELKELEKEKKREYWRKYVEELSEGDDAGKVWKTIKSLSTVDKGEAPNEILIAEGREARTDKQKAESFVRMYAEVNKVKKGKDERRKRVDVMKRLKDYEEGEEYGRRFTAGELDGALEQIGEGKKGGVDVVEAAMMKRLGKERG